MQFTLIAFTAILGIASACKCTAGADNSAFTEICCGRLNGNFVNGNDCAAGSISESLSDFKRCCGDVGGPDWGSDCDCPTCRVEGEEG